MDKHFLARQSFRCWSNGNKRETNSFGVRQIHLAWDKFIWRETNSFGGRQKKTNSFRGRQKKTNSFRGRQIHFAWDKFISRETNSFGGRQKKITMPFVSVQMFRCGTNGNVLFYTGDKKITRFSNGFMNDTSTSVWSSRNLS